MSASSEYDPVAAQAAFVNEFETSGPIEAVSPSTYQEIDAETWDAIVRAGAAATAARVSMAGDQED